MTAPIRSTWSIDFKTLSLKDINDKTQINKQYSLKISECMQQNAPCKEMHVNGICWNWTLSIQHKTFKQLLFNSTPHLRNQSFSKNFHLEKSTLSIKTVSELIKQYFKVSQFSRLLLSLSRWLLLKVWTF